MRGHARLLRAAAVAVLALAVAACSPTGPSGAADGATIYEHPNYGGDARRLGADERDLKDVRGPCGERWWDDCVSSIRVPQGWNVTIYEDPNFRGGSLTITSDVPDLDRVNGPCSGDWENCVSSIRVSRP